ncbi:unnamed protein product, partial [marine sediment metagenome]
ALSPFSEATIRYGSETYYDLRVSRPAGGILPGTIVGAVTDAGTQDAISNANVGLDFGNLSTDTDGEGAYLFAALPAGGYLIEASATGYGSASVSVEVISGEVATSNIQLAGIADLLVSGNSVILSEAQPSADVDIINEGLGLLRWSATSDNPAVTVSPASGTGEQALTITATDFTEDLAAQVAVTNDDNPSDTETITVQVDRTPTPADLEVSANGVLLSEGTPSVSVNILNLGEVDLNWSASSNDATVTLTPDNVNDTLTITATDFME